VTDPADLLIRVLCRNEPKDQFPVELLSLDSSVLIIAEIQSMTIWIISIIAGLVGTGICQVKFRANRD